MLPARILEFWVRRNVQHVILHVTNRCNLRCSHCFVDFSGAAEMPPARYRELGREMGHIMWLDISGGEPFLRTDLTGIISSFNSEVVQIPTNGSMPELIHERTREIVRSTKAKVALSISIDGLEALHDRIRGKPGSWKKAWETFDLLRKDGIPVKINTVLTNKNKAELLPLMEFVKTKAPDFHSVILHRGKARDPDFGLPPLQEVRAMGPSIFRILSTYSYGQSQPVAYILRNYHKYLWNLSLETLEAGRQQIPCLAGQAHMVIYADGTVSSCEMLPTIGSVAAQDWNELLKTDAFKKQRESIRRKACHCTHNCAMIDSIFFRLESFFPLLHQKLETGPVEKQGKA